MQNENHKIEIQMQIDENTDEQTEKSLEALRQWIEANGSTSVAGYSNDDVQELSWTVYPCLQFYCKDAATAEILRILLLLAEQQANGQDLDQELVTDEMLDKYWLAQRLSFSSDPDTPRWQVHDISSDDFDTVRHGDVAAMHRERTETDG